MPASTRPVAVAQTGVRDPDAAFIMPASTAVFERGFLAREQFTARTVQALDGPAVFERGFLAREQFIARTVQALDGPAVFERGFSARGQRSRHGAFDACLD